MNRFLLVVFCIVLGCVAAKNKQKISCYKKLCYEVVGKSGKIKISRGNKIGSDADSLMIDFDEILEVNAKGKSVGRAGKVGHSEGHSFKNFAKLDFTFSELYNATVKGIKAIGFNFTASIPGPNATLQVQTFILKRNSTISICDEEETIKSGMLKFNIVIKNWKFCGGAGGDVCNKKEVGKYIDFKITLKSPGNKKAKRGKKPKKDKKGKKRPKNLFFRRMKMAFLESVTLSNKCVNMPEGYPKYEEKGSKQSVTFRFPKFDKELKYDPTVDADYGEPDPSELEDDKPTTGASSLHAILTLPALLVSIMYVLW